MYLVLISYILVSLYQNITYFTKYTTKRNFEMRTHIFSFHTLISCLVLILGIYF